MATSDATCGPNHHAGHPGCGGVRGLLAGLTMVVGRAGDAELAARLTGLAAGDRLVDLGCGPGAAARHAARSGAEVTAVDPAAVMLALGRRLTRLTRLRRPTGPVTYVEAAAESLPLPDDGATVLWTIASVHHWHDVAAGLREVRRVLAPGGRFLAIERHTTPGATGLASHGWTDGQAAAFADMCRDAGFGDVRVERHTVGRRRRLVAVLAGAPADERG